MEQANIKATVKDAEALFKTIMRLYWDYLNELERFLKTIPEDAVSVIEEINLHIQDVQVAMEHDIGLFQKATDGDMEDIGRFAEQLKIQEIYKKLKSK